MISNDNNPQNKNAELTNPEKAVPIPSAVVNATDMLGEYLQNPLQADRVYLDAEGNPIAQDTPNRKRRFALPVWLRISGAFVLGLTLGVLVMKQRHAADKVIATVGGETIQAQEFYRRLESIAGSQALHQMIEESLTRQYVQQRHLLPTPAEVQATASQIGAQTTFASPTQRPLDPNVVKQAAQAQSLQERMVAKGVEVTDPEIQAYYRAQTDPHNPAARFFRPETAHLAVIVTPSEAQAQQAESELRRGTPFGSVAKKYSKDRSAATGGELTPLLRGRTPARKVPGLEDIVFGLKPGETTRPQKLMGAWWILTCLDKSPPETLPFAQVQAQCQREARLLKALRLQGGQAEADFEKYCQSVPVQVFWERYTAAALNQEHKITSYKF